MKKNGPCQYVVSARQGKKKGESMLADLGVREIDRQGERGREN